MNTRAVMGEQSRDPSSPLLEFLETLRARPSVPRLEGARDHWHSIQSIIDRVSALQSKVRCKPKKGKAAVCGVLGVAVMAAIQERIALNFQDTTAIKSLQVLVQSLQVCIADLQGKLQDKRGHSDNLQQVLGDILARDATGPTAASPGAVCPAAAVALPDDVMARAVAPVYAGRELAAVCRLKLRSAFAP